MSERARGAQGAADAFAAGADPSLYVPRLALEAALAELSEGIGKRPACAALTGDTGLGKTLLLGVLRERLGGAFECLYLPSPRVDVAGLWRWAAIALGLGAGDDDRGAVLGRARRLRQEGSGLVLLVDDAGGLPPATRADLLAALDTPGFSLVLALGSEDREPLESLPAFVRRVEVGPPMTLAETRAYVHARLRRVDPEGELAARLGAEQLAALHDASGGVPARLHVLLEGWLRSLEGEGPSREPAAAAEPLPELPESVRSFARRLDRPAVRFTLLALALAVTVGAWYLAWQKGPGPASVGVPLEPADSHTRAPLSPAPVASPPGGAADVAAEPPPPGPVAEPAPEPPPAAEPNRAPESGPTSTGPAPATPGATAARARARSLAPPLPASPPLPDPGHAEAPVHVSSPRFPDEHVPLLLEPEPLAAPPAGPRLSVNARPWAAIRLDGTPVGETPLGELRVAPGPHVVSAQLPDGRVLERRVEARPGDVYVVFDEEPERAAQPLKRSEVARRETARE